LGAKEAKDLGMIDRIATLDETVSRLASKGADRVVTIAEAQEAEIVAQEATEEAKKPNLEFRRRRARRNTLLDKVW
jgi:ClpP class serine protease